MSGFNISDLLWGTLNYFTDTLSHNSGDPRRGDARDFLNKMLDETYGRNTLEDVDVLTGIIIGSLDTYQIHAAQKAGLLTDFVLPNSSTELQHAYKVYIPEIEPSPIPKGVDDPILWFYPNIFPTGHISQRGQLPVGTVVTVEYTDFENLLDPMIISVEGEISLAFPSKRTGGLPFKFKKAPPLPPRPESPLGPYSPSEQRPPRQTSGTHGSELFYKGNPGTTSIAIGASYVRGNQSFAKQMGMDRFARSGAQIDFIKEQIPAAISDGVLNFSKYKHAFFFTGPNSLALHQDGAKVFGLLSGLISEVKSYNPNIKITVVTIQGFSRWGLMNKKKTNKKTGAVYYQPRWGNKKNPDGTVKTSKVARATKAYNELIEAKGGGIDYVIKWAQKGTIDYNADISGTDLASLEKFTIPRNWESDALHANSAGHKKIVEMIMDPAQWMGDA
jgi:hypothetical protein